MNFQQLCSTTPQISSPILDENGTLMSTKAKKAIHWQQYYEALLNHPMTAPPHDLVQCTKAAADEAVDYTAAPTMYPT